MEKIMSLIHAGEIYDPLPSPWRKTHEIKIVKFLAARIKNVNVLAARGAYATLSTGNALGVPSLWKKSRAKSTPEKKQFFALAMGN